MTPRDPQGETRPKPRCVLITGCSSGIGYTCAHGLARRGWSSAVSS